MNNHISNTISDLSYIHPEAQIGKAVSISSFCHIDKDVIIGEGTWIGPNVTIFDGARIGKNCKIFPGAVIAGVPQDLKFKGEKTTIEIGDNTIIREYATLNRGTSYNNKTIIGSDCLLMAYVHVAHDCVLGNNVVLANNVNLAGHVTIDDYAILEGLVAVQQFVRIGAHSFIAGGSLVRKNVPPYVKAAREPLSYIGVNTVGLKRRGFDSQAIKNIQGIYRPIFVNGFNIGKALNIVEEKFDTDNPECKNILQFIYNSSKGIMKGLHTITSNGEHSKNGIYTTE